MADELPTFGSEYAKSDRSQCKLCKSCISQGSLRLAIYVQSPFFDGKMPQWYHFTCFFKKAKGVDTSYIKGFDALRWDDQQKIKEKLGQATSSSNDADGVKSESSAGSKLENFAIEYSKSNRSKCKTCDARIEKDAIRMNVKSNEKTNDGNYHLECFNKKRDELGFNFNPEELHGFSDLQDKDQEHVKTLLKPNETSLKRKIKDEVKEEDDENVDPAKKLKKEKSELEDKLKNQSQFYWKVKDQLDKELPNDVIKQLLEENDQILSKSGRDDILNLLCDCMCYGPLLKCPECKNGQLVCRSLAYYCTGNITQWTRCSYTTQDPKRADSFKLSDDLKEDYECLKKFKFTPQKRLFAKSLEEIQAAKTQVKDEVKVKLPLSKLNFSSAGKLTKKNPKIKQIIESLGGNFKSEVTAETVAVFSNQAEVDKLSKKIQECKSLDVHVVDEAILDELNSQNIDIESLISKHNICAWGSDVKTRIKLSTELNQKKEIETLEKKFIPKSVGDGTGKIKMKIKGGAVVDPDSGMEDDGHILCEDSGHKEPYSCVLGLVDIMRGTNSFYKLQIIEHDKHKQYYLFRAWGRVGTTIGGNKLETYSNKSDVINQFEALYLDKTGNNWSSRKTSSKIPNKFYPLEMDYGENETDTVKSKINDKDFISKSKLDTPIQNLIKLIFDINAMKEQMKEFEIDLNKMPLGKISSNQIKMAFAVLNELNTLIENKSSNTLIVDASNRFYTLIPHDFGMKKPLILDDTKLIKDKTDMLNNLLDIEIAYNLLNIGGAENDEDPIDAHYKKLKCEMFVLDRNCLEFKQIVQYVKNTHAKTHSSYELIVEDVFKVNRDGEESKYEKYKTLHNRKLLWHGSRLTNFAGILSQGLRIAPPEAPATGYMFGKGVYFADMVSKSANYCFTSNTNPTGLLLLCEVALGNMYERVSAEYVTKLPADKHSTKGCGRTEPDPKGTILTPEGYEIPTGQGTASKKTNSSLLYNEYIVYDTAQIKMKYLIRMKFKYVY